MSKYDYFSSLLRLGELQKRVAILLMEGICEGACKSVSEISDLNRESNLICAEIDAALFDEFLPPIERVSISSCAHALNEVVGAAFEVSSVALSASGASRRSAICEEASVCCELAAMTEGAVCTLAKKNSRSALPDTYAFRLCLNKGRGVHSTFCSRVSFSDARREQGALIMGIEYYRRTMAHAYDEIIEAILENV